MRLVKNIFQRLEGLENFLDEGIIPETLRNATEVLEETAREIQKTNDRNRAISLSRVFEKLKKLHHAQMCDRLADSRNVHFMHNDKFANPTIAFINRHFPSEDNLFLVCRTNDDNYAAQKFPEGRNVLESDCYLLDAKNFKDKKLIFHSLFNPNAVAWLYLNRDLLQHSYWMVWGKDLYAAPTDEMNTFVRQNIYGIGSFCDNGLAAQKYGGNHVFFNTNMVVPPTPLAPNIALKIRKENDPTVIQLNNSADDSTLEILDILAKFKNENIEIRTVLSYGKTQFNRQIIEKGQSIFGDKFSYLAKMIDPDDYAEYLAQNDIFILYQNRQQGGGNLFTSLALGKKVFLRYEVTTAQALKQGNFVFFDSNKIKDMSFGKFCEISEEAIENNVKIMKTLNADKLRTASFSMIFDHVAKDK